MQTNTQRTASPTSKPQEAIRHKRLVERGYQYPRAVNTKRCFVWIVCTYERIDVAHKIAVGNLPLWIALVAGIEAHLAKPLHGGVNMACPTQRPHLVTKEDPQRGAQEESSTCSSKEGY